MILKVNDSNEMQILASSHEQRNIFKKIDVWQSNEKVCPLIMAKPTKMTFLSEGMLAI